MNTTTSINIRDQIKAYIDQIKAEKKAIEDQFKKDLESLENAKKEKLKEIDSQLDEIRNAIPSSDSEKPSKRKYGKLENADLSEKIRALLGSPSDEIKTADLLNQLGILRPRLDKYLKSPDCMIKSKKEGKGFVWSLK
jgi:cell division septum initiation protein DivIVA